ncbi:MAG: ricin-type beta-trefoil lectin domain protein [Trebonia sp.]
MSIRPGRSRILAVAASVLLSGAALAAATAPAQAAVPPTPPNVITVTPSVATETAPYDVPFKVPVAVAETDATAQLTITLTENPPLPAADTVTVAPATPAPAATTTVDVTGTLPAAYTGVVTVSATDGMNIGENTFGLTAKNTVSITGIKDQADPPGTAITPLPVVAADSDTVTPPTASNTLAYTATGLTAAGLAINADTGLITGTPPKDGTFPVTVTATDGTGATGTAAFTWTVGPVEKIVVTAPAKTQVYTGVAVGIKPKATDSTAKAVLTWAAAGLPPGLSISKSTGAITGRPAKAGKYNAVKLSATDAATKAAGTLTVAIVVSYPFDILNLDPGAKSTTVGHGLDIRFGDVIVLKGIKVTSLSAKNLPAGMGLAAKPAMLYGWPTKAGTYGVVINGTGTSGATSTTTFKLVVKAAPDSGATGQVALARGGKCLLDPGGHTANGTKAEISNCVSGSTEKWTVASDATLRVNGRCLDISGSGGSSGRVAELWSCNGSTREQWTQGTDGELVNRASGVCLTDPSTRNGTAVQTGACHAKSSGQWALPAQPILASLGGSCADDPHGVGSNGTVVDMFWCNGTRGQAWVFEPNGRIRISQYSNVCLTVHKSQPVLWVCGAASGQAWSVNRIGSLGSELTAGGVCLATKSLTAANAAKLTVTKCAAGNPLDLWHIG